MSKHNYSQYSKKNENKVEEQISIQPIKTVTEIVIDSDAVESVAEVKMEPEVVVIEETVDTVALPKTATGVIFNCNKLNVRSKPSTDADIVTILDNDSEVVIDSARSTTDWLKITTAVGVEGYCMTYGKYTDIDQEAAWNR